MNEKILTPAGEAPETVMEETIPEALLPAETAPAEPRMATVVDIHFRSNSKLYFFDPGDLALKAGDHVIIDTARGSEFGYCTAGNHQVPYSDIVPPLRRVLRLATERDERVNAENVLKEKKAYEVCQQKIQAHGLDMQLVSAECAFDGSKIIFFFTADGRVDFRELVKNLASVFRTRIELRQIGVRDKAKMVGGLGVCGRPFCCKEFLDDFQPVSIKMAKTQSLSLNPTKISGTCGRLMCCLKYEQDAYEDLLKTSPKNESFVDTVDGRGTVVDVNLLRQTVKVRMEDQPDTVNCYRNCDICVLRSGKAKKNDPPIPKDLAPISSKPRPAKKQEQEEELMPEIIITGRDLPPVISEPAAENTESAARSRRRRKKPAAQSEEAASRVEVREKSRPAKEDRPKSDKPRQPKPEPKAEAEDSPKAESSRSSAHRRRRRPRGSKPGGENKGGASEG